MNVRYSPDEKECWEHLYVLGFSCVQISTIRGSSLSSVKKHIKNLKISRSYSEAHKGRIPWNKNKSNVQIPWNKGKKGIFVNTRKGTKQPKRGPRKPDHIQKIKEGWKRKLDSGWNQFGGYGANLGLEHRSKFGVLYFIRYLDGAGTHFKIGITRRSLNKRFKNNQLVSIIYLHYSTLGECFDLEQKILNWARRNKYRYSSPTTTELIKPEAYTIVLEWLRNVETFTPPGR